MFENHVLLRTAMLNALLNFIQQREKKEGTKNSKGGKIVYSTNLENHIRLEKV